ncbi:MAG TPA: hypothetical protein VFG89_03520 [Coriobacteriia bacterium]|nr:hypothetical protein [Coriobacteriia bacterium]
MPIVLVVMVMLFVLATMVLAMVAQSTFSSTRRTAQTKAVHMADAGLNAYLYELRRNPSYYVAHPTLGPTTLEDGTWSVASTAPTSEDPLMLRVTGAIPSMDSTSVVIASVRFPTYADYMFLTDAFNRIGSGATIVGKVRSNEYIENDGRITGVAEAVDHISGSGVFGGGKKCPVPIVDFAQVTADLGDIRNMATAAGTYFGPSGALGYRATVSGNRVTVLKITAMNTTTGVISSSTTVGIYTIPASGVMYFNDKVYVSGTYSERLTIASAQTIYIVDNFVPANLNSTATSGLIGAQDIIVPTRFTSVPSTMQVTAALLAQNGQIYGECYSGYYKTKITILGSIACKGQPYFVSGSTGWASRVYDYDERLDIHPPPMFPQIRDGTLKISTWNED